MPSGYYHHQRGYSSQTFVSIDQTGLVFVNSRNDVIYKVIGAKKMLLLRKEEKTAIIAVL